MILEAILELAEISKGHVIIHTYFPRGLFLTLIP